MTPTPDSFRALARSSPWRWTTLHFTHRDDQGEVEAWVRRPGWLRVRRPGESDVVENEPPSTRREVAPILRPDGLVAERLDDCLGAYDDPMYDNYTWVAMLDPVELSHHVEVDAPAAEVWQGRAVWRARLTPQDGYDPRCSCCPLLWSVISDTEEHGAAQPGHTYPAAYDVALDVETGVVVSVSAVGKASVETDFELTILDVDTVLDDRFPS